jgi:hypothetical protein
VAAGSIAELTGTGHGLLVEVDDDPAPLEHALRARGLSVEREGVRLTVTAVPTAAEDDIYDVVRDALVVSGVGVHRLTNRTVRLEDVFLEVGA